MQVYRGLPLLTNQPDRPTQLVGVWELDHEASVAEYAPLAHAAIDAAIDQGRTAIVVGGTGLYLRAALAELKLRPPVPVPVRERVEAEIAARGPEALHDELEPPLAAGVHPRDRKRIARALELQRAGLDPPPPDGGELWTARLRRPTLLAGIVCDRAELDVRIDARVDSLVAAGATEEARRAAEAGVSRTARAALGFEELLRGDIDAMKREHRRYARRQLTWMRKMRGVRLIDRTGWSDAEVARQIDALLDRGVRA
jgi:tRNA dimethylallyltransferase